MWASSVQLLHAQYTWHIISAILVLHALSAGLNYYWLIGRSSMWCLCCLGFSLLIIHCLKRPDSSHTCRQIIIVVYFSPPMMQESLGCEGVCTAAQDTGIPVFYRHLVGKQQRDCAQMGNGPTTTYSQRQWTDYGSKCCRWHVWQLWYASQWPASSHNSLTFNTNGGTCWLVVKMSGGIAKSDTFIQWWTTCEIVERQFVLLKFLLKNPEFTILNMRVWCPFSRCTGKGADYVRSWQ